MTETRTPESGRKAPPAPSVSYDEFLEWADEDVRAEWIDGAIQTMKPASTLHQRIVRFLSGVLSAWVEERKAGEVFVAPFQMKLEERPSGREPDVLVVTESHLNRVQETHLGGPADVVFEVVSAESGPRDRGDKFYEYEAAGIPEYWIVDPEREQLEVYRLVDDRYENAFMGATGRVESHALEGLWIRAEWFWQEPLPNVLDVLSALDLV